MTKPEDSCPCDEDNGHFKLDKDANTIICVDCGKVYVVLCIPQLKEMARDAMLLGWIMGASIGLSFGLLIGALLWHN